MEGRSVLLLITAGLLQLMLSASADVVPMYPPYTTASPELFASPLWQRNQPDAANESTEQWKKDFTCKLAFQTLLNKVATIRICGIPMKTLGDLIMRNGDACKMKSILDQIVQNYQGVNYNPMMLTKCKDLPVSDEDKKFITKFAKYGEAVGEKLEDAEKFFNHLSGLIRP